VQSISGYLYNQTMDVVIILDSLPNRENMLVYAKPLQIYKGIDNKIKLLIKNQDQKLQNLLDTQIIFNLIDSATSELIFTRLVAAQVNKGTAYITLDQMDLNDLPAGIYNYSLQLISGEGESRIIYSDDNYNAQGQTRVVDGVYPTFRPSIQPKLGPFYNNNPNPNGYQSDTSTIISDVINVLDRVKSRTILQTVQYYGTGFTGTVTIQGSLSATITAYPDDWFNIDNQTFSSFTGCQFSTFTGKIGLVRFKIHTIDGSLDKILYRP
jgi:hypothetical protein